MVLEFVNAKTRDEHEFTPLHFASYNGNALIIQYLISLGADPFLLSKRRMNMIHLAA